MRITSYTVELNGKLNVLVKDDAVNYNATSLNSADLIADMMNNIFRLNLKAEEFVYVIAMNTKCYVLGVFLLSKGSVNNSLVSPRDIFVRLFLCGACNFVLVHNHPSGDTAPSNEDINMTKRINECATLMGVKLLDHIIVGDNYYSFKEHDIL